MKKIINLTLARALRASLNAQIVHLQHITNELALIDVRENPQHPQNPADQFTDAQAIGSLIEQAAEALARADGMLTSQVGDSKVFTLPPTFVCWLMQVWGRK